MQYLLKSCFLLAFITLCGCATGNFAPSERTFKAMQACVKEAKENPIRAKCDKRFKDTPITGKLEEVAIYAGSISVNIRTSATPFRVHSISCITGSKDAKKVEKLSAGDTVTVQGIMSSASQIGNITSIILNPCDLVEHGELP